MEKRKSLTLEERKTVPNIWEPSYTVKCFGDEQIIISVEQYQAIEQAVASGEAPDHIVLEGRIKNMKAISSIDPTWPNHVPPRPEPIYGTREMVEDGKTMYQKYIKNKSIIDLWIKIFDSGENLLLTQGGAIK